MSRWAPIMAMAAVVTAGVTPTAQAATPPTPIPTDPGASSVVTFLGEPAKPHRVSFGTAAPRQPYMAPNQDSNIHDDAYQSDAYQRLGPLGHSPRVTSALFAQECASVTFDAHGRILTVCVGVSEVTLRLLDPKSLATLASYDLGPRKTSSGSTPFNSFGGGGYFYLDRHDRVVVPTAAGDIKVIRESGSRSKPSLHLAHSYDVSKHIGSGLIESALPDWSGRLWFITTNGVVGVVNRHTGAIHTRRLPHHETIGNSFAVDETDGVYVVSDHALYRFGVGHHGKPVTVWREKYNAGHRTKPGQSEFGSGTTPTIVRRGGHHYVSITDNADPRMHVLVYRADRHVHGHRLICSQPVFGKRRGDTDNSLIAYGSSQIVENNYGYSGAVVAPKAGNPNRTTPTSLPGITRIHVNYAHGGCHVVWTNHKVRIPSSVSKASTGAGLVYVYEHPSAGEVHYTSGKQPATGAEDPWYLTALSLRTGRRVFSVLAGVGFGYNNNYAPITIGPSHAAYIGVLGGLVEVRDG